MLAEKLPTELARKNELRAHRDATTAIRFLTGNAELSGFSGRSVLDLGCGSPWNEYPPFFCYLVGKNGAETYGVDMLQGSVADIAVYTHIQVDIVPLVQNQALGTLGQLHGKTFDVIHVGINLGGFLSTHLRMTMGNLDVRAFDSLLVSQAQTMLKNGGVLGVAGGEMNWWQRIDGQMIIIE